MQILKLLNDIRLFYSRSANRVHTQCFASASPNDTLHVPDLESWTLVSSGFKVDCEYRLNVYNPDDTENGYHVALEIKCKFSRLTDRKFFIECTCLESSNSTMS